MKKIYYLKTCDTCKRILKQIKNLNDFELQDIKEEALTAAQLDELKKRTGSYEKLFSKRAKLYKEMGLKDEKLTETDYKRYILEHYTFLARPVILFNDVAFVGNSTKTVEEMVKTVNA